MTAPSTELNVFTSEVRPLVTAEGGGTGLILDIVMGCRTGPRRYGLRQTRTQAYRRFGNCGPR